MCHTDPVWGYYDARWLTGLWSTQAKVEGVVLNAAWHWSSDRSIVNDSHGELGRVCRPSVRVGLHVR